MAIANINLHWLFMLFTFKDNINKMLHSNLGYYGKTKRHFKVRVCEHLGITILTGKKIKSPKKVQYLIIFSIRVIKQVVLILKSLSKILMNLDSFSDESRFYIAWWTTFELHNYLQFSFIISIIVVTLDNLTIYRSSHRRCSVEKVFLKMSQIS